MIWERLEPGKYEGLVAKAGKGPTVVTIEKAFFERPGRGKALHSTVFEEAWKGALYRSLSFDIWFSCPKARIYPAIPKNAHISKKEASCVES